MLLGKRIVCTQQHKSIFSSCTPAPACKYHSELLKRILYTRFLKIDLQKPFKKFKKYFRFLSGSVNHVCLSMQRQHPGSPIEFLAPGYCKQQTISYGND